MPIPISKMTTSLHLALNHLKPIVHFLLYHTVHCTEKIVSACWRAGSSLAERVGQGEVGGVTHTHGGCCGRLQKWFD